jgi:hypothetical protein
MIWRLAPGLQAQPPRARRQAALAHRSRAAVPRHRGLSQHVHPAHPRLRPERRPGRLHRNNHRNVALRSARDDGDQPALDCANGRVSNPRPRRLLGFGPGAGRTPEHRASYRWSRPSGSWGDLGQELVPVCGRRRGFLSTLRPRCHRMRSARATPARITPSRSRPWLGLWSCCHLLSSGSLAQYRHRLRSSACRPLLS